MLQVIISGGGIAGLSAALALRRAGHAVHVFERSRSGREIGAAMHVPPNVSRTLLRLGVDPVRGRFVTIQRMVRYDAETMANVYDVSEDWVEERYGGPWWLAHRVDLHDELRRLATQEEGYGPPVSLHLSSEVVHYDPDVPSMTLATGEILTGDVVIAADGIHSRAAETILGAPNAPQPQTRNNFVYRFLIPAADIEEDDATKFWLDEGPGCMKLVLGDRKRIVTYPCRNNEVHNFALIFHKEGVDKRMREDWSAPVDKEDMLKEFASFHPKVKKILKKATNVTGWVLLYRPPIQTWSKGRMTMVGDAAHPMLPHQGQGGAQAIEDGLALGVAMIGASRDDVPARIEAYEAIRKPRASAITVLSNAGQDEPESISEQVSKYLPASRIPKTPGEFHDFNFSYDIVSESYAHLKALDPSFEIPHTFMG